MEFYWVYETCEKCGYQTSHEKLGVEKHSSHTTDELMDIFINSKCSCGEPFKGDLEWYEHPGGVNLITF